MLATVGELAAVAGPAMRPHMGGVLPLVIDAVQDPSASALRATGVITLSQVGGRSRFPAAGCAPSTQGTRVSGRRVCPGRRPVAVLTAVAWTAGRPAGCCGVPSAGRWRCH